MNHPYTVIYSPQARDDLRDIYTYIASDLQVPDTAKNQINRVRTKIRSLDFMPARYSVVGWEPWQSMQMHKLPVDNFIVYYIVDSEIFTVTVIRIVYAGRDPRNIIPAE